jgi:hypothetical protein
VGRGLAVAVWAGAALLSAITALSGIQPNDEGLMLQAATRIADGQVPYRDFWWFYPPGQPVLLAGLQELVGPSLVTWRVVRVAADATVAALAFALARRHAPPRLALVAGLAAALAMAFPSGPHPFPLALAFALGALLLAERRPVLAGVLVGLCGAWRLEFAAYLALGLVVARPPGLLRLLGAATAVGLAVYVPTAALAGIGPAWDLLVAYPVTEFGDYQSLPFPVLSDGPFRAGSAGELLTTVEEVLIDQLPLVLVAGLAACLLALRERRQLAAAVFAVGMAHYLVVRADLFHTAPLAVMVAVLGAWAVARPRTRRRLHAATALVAAVVLAYLVVEGLDRRVLALRDLGVPLDVPVADGVRVRPSVAGPLERTVAYVRARVPEGEPLYVTGRRADLVTAGHPLLYVLTGTANPTRYDIAAPGVVTTAPVQREIVAAIERARPRLVVRWTDPVTAAPEPNRAGRSTGVVALDEHLARAYAPVARFGAFVVLSRR